MTSAKTQRTESNPTSDPKREAPTEANYARDRNLSLRQAFAIFVRQTPPKVLLVAVGIGLATRLWRGGFDRWDLVPLVVLPLLHPFVEWLIHVFILHHRPRKIGPFTFDFHAAKHHRAHHVDPWNLKHVVMPLPILFVGAVFANVACWFALPTVGSFHTAMVLVGITAVTYEWLHFLTHTSYRPRGAWYRRIYKFHRLHHFKNENYWMGVTRHFGDRVLGTMKDASEVETSPTARDLLARE